MKGESTHLSHKCEHAIDRERQLRPSTRTTQPTAPDPDTSLRSVHEGQENPGSGSEAVIEEVLADKGYHSTEIVTVYDEHGVPTNIREPTSKYRRKWRGRPKEQRRVVTKDRRLVPGNRSKKQQSERSAKVERSFAYPCGTGGTRRIWLRGLLDISKRYDPTPSRRNLWRLLYLLFGIGTPRSLQSADAGFGDRLAAAGRLLSCRVGSKAIKVADPLPSCSLGDS